MAGPLSPKLFVSTSGTDSDFDVKLIDVYPPDFTSPKGERKRAAEKGRGHADGGNVRVSAIGARRAVPRQVSDTGSSSPRP